MPSYSDDEPFFERFDSHSAFAFYEAVRHRLPQAQFADHSQPAQNLLALADAFDVFVFDAFGVLNVGNTAIAGAPETVEALRAMGKALFVVTNAATFPRPASIEKFRRLGFDFTDDEIVTSRMAAEHAITSRSTLHWGIMAKQDSQAADMTPSSSLLREDKQAYDRADAFLLISTWEWNSAQQQLLEQSLADRMRPVVVANPDVIAPLEARFSTEAGYVAHRLADRLSADIEFHGKPFASVFELVETALPQAQDKRRICMIGDTLHTDVLGGAARGWSTVLVSDHGLFRGHDVKPFIETSGIVPDWIIASI